MNYLWLIQASSNSTYTTSSYNKESFLRFIVEGQYNISLELYEGKEFIYGEKPIIYYDSYKIIIKDDYGKIHEIEGENRTNKITLKLNTNESSVLHNLLMTNKKLIIDIVQINTYDNTRCCFTVDCTGYGKVFKRLKDSTEL